MNIDGINKKHGTVLTSARHKYDLQPKPYAISTGSLNVDWALGGNTRWGGIYRGLITTMWGEKGMGKTTLTSSIIAQAQQAGLQCGYVDIEAKYDLEYAIACGVNVDELLYLDTVPEEKDKEDLSGEQIITITEKIIRSGNYALIVLDSITALSPKREQDGLYGESHFGLQARLVSQAMRRLKSAIRKHNVAFLIISQARANTKQINAYSPRSILPGARAMQHQSAVIVKLSRAKNHNIKRGNEIIGGNFLAYTEHNQVNAPCKAAIFAISDSLGLDSARDVLSYAGKVSFINKKGSWFNCFDPKTGEEIRLGQGEDSAVSYLRADQNLLFALQREIKETFQDDTSK